GYQHYEVSAYACPDHRCRHNLNYWQFGDYLGIGAGAHGKLSDTVNGSIIRTRKIANPERYMAQAGNEHRQKRQVLSPADKRTEFLLNALRLTDGFTPELFVRTTGLSMAQLAPGLESARLAGLLGNEPERVRPTSKGRRYLNNLLQHFV
ncbi:MAG: oxygen-independent coproporphyrinogen III oxidase-like protein, partial [Gammaproteobacteria bacterium]